MNIENNLQFLAVYSGKLYLKLKLQLNKQSKSTINKKYYMCQVLSSEKVNIL